MSSHTAPTRWSGRPLRYVSGPILITLLLIVVCDALAAQARRRGRAATAAHREETIRHDGRVRSYLVHDYARGPRAPVVIVLHGGGGNAENAVTMTGFDRIAAREGV